LAATATVQKSRRHPWWTQLWVWVLAARQRLSDLHRFGLVLGVHRLMSQGLTPTNYLGNAVATSSWPNGKARSMRDACIAF
jgi:Na+/H+-dicarboxylate symporter